MRAKEISEQLARRAEEVASHLLPAGKRVRDEWHAGDVGGSKGESLKVTLKGDKKGLWFDFATTEGGDLLELWRLNRHIGLPEAIIEAKHYWVLLSLFSRHSGEIIICALVKKTWVRAS